MISILVCTNRPKWEPFLKVNLKRLLDYSLQFGITAEVLFDRHPTTTIGKKRNDLCRRAKGKYLMFVDDDDYQYEYRIMYQLSILKKGPYECCYNNPTLNHDLDTGKEYVLRGPTEGSFMFTKEFFDKSKGFCELNKAGEGLQFLQSGDITKIYTIKDVKLIMLINHSNNTVRRRFKD